MKAMKKLGHIVAMAGLLAAGSANAAPTVQANWGIHDDPAEHASISLPKGAGTFDHVFTFSLTGWNDLVSIAVTNDFLKYNIDNASLQFWKETSIDGNYTNDLSLGSFSFDSTAVGADFGNIGPGNYYYEIKGSVIGSKGGTYTVDSYVTAVPEPETYAMLLAGLGLVGFTLRGKRNR